MKEVTAKLNKLAISPRKVRLIADLIRGASVNDAQNQLKYNPKMAARSILKLLNSAIANADHNFKMDTDDLVVKAITVGPGTVTKRFKPRAFGRATTIRKRTSHVTLVLEGVDPQEKSVKVEASKKEKPVQKKVEEKVISSQQENKSLSAGHSHEIIDPRRRGHENKNQHVDKKMKEKPSIQKNKITRTHNK